MLTIAGGIVLGFIAIVVGLFALGGGITLFQAFWDWATSPSKAQREAQQAKWAANRAATGNSV